MPRYHFHTRDGSPVQDQRGTELRDDEEARAMAARLLAELLQENPGHLWETRAFEVRVTDHTGLTLFVIDVSATEAAAVAKAPHRVRGTPP